MEINFRSDFISGKKIFLFSRRPLECPADVLLTLTLDRWGRRWLAFGTMVLSGVFSILATFFPAGRILLEI